MRLHVGLKVRLYTMDNPLLHDATAVVQELTAYGAVVEWENHGRCGTYRAFARELCSDRPQQAAFAYATGDVCDKCGSANVVRTGTCATCQDCGNSVGGCV